MALDKQGSSATKRRPSLRGSLLSYVRAGTEVQAKWPRKRGPSKTQKEQDRKNFFTAVQFAYRWLEPNMKIQLREAVAGTPLLPRDLWLSIAAGNFGSIGLLSGKVMYSMADMKKVSASVDALAQDKGDLLVRGSEFWQALAAGTNGQILTAQGTAALPIWANPPAASGGSLVASATASTEVGSSIASCYVPKEGATVAATPGSANNLAVTFTATVAQNVKVDFFALFWMGLANARKRFALTDTAGNVKFPRVTASSQPVNTIYSRLQGELLGQQVQFSAIIPVAAGTYTWVVRADDAVANASCQWDDRCLSVLAK